MRHIMFVKYTIIALMAFIATLQHPVSVLGIAYLGLWLCMLTKHAAISAYIVMTKSPDELKDLKHRAKKKLGKIRQMAEDPAKVAMEFAAPVILIYGGALYLALAWVSCYALNYGASIIRDLRIRFEV